MKVLMLSQGRSISDQPDYDLAFRRAKSGGQGIELINIPLVGYVETHGATALYSEIVRINNEFRPDLVFFQFFHAHAMRDCVDSPIDCVNALRASTVNVPLVFGSWGDPFNVGLQAFVGTPAPRHTYQLASVADAFFPTSMGPTADSLVRHGARNVVFLPNAFCSQHFKLADVCGCTDKKHDVVMLGSCCKYLHPRIYWSFVRAYSRNKTVRILSRRFGGRFAVFGAGWDGCPSWRGTVPFKDQMSVFESARVAVDAPAQIDYDYYTSDRAFFIAGSGTPLVMKYIYGLEKMLADRHHAYYARTIADFPKVCDEILALPDDLLRQRKKDTINVIKQRHLVDHRVDTIISVAEALRNAREGRYSVRDACAHLRLHHFLPNVDVRAEFDHCIRNWEG